MQRRQLLTLPFAAALPVHAAPPSTALSTVQVLTPPLAMPGLNRQRTLRLCLPPSYATFRSKHYPVIYMHDGQNLFDAATGFAGEWGVDETMAQLAQETGFEALVVGIDNGGDKRGSEMAPFDHERLGKSEGRAYLDFIAKTVKPFIDAGWRTRPEREHTALIGSSLGGLISHAAMLWHGDVFSRYGLFSPSYWAAPQLFDLTEKAVLQPGTRVHLYCGGREGGSMANQTRDMHRRLARQLPADRLSLTIAADAEHNEAAWRAELPNALKQLFIR
ncbi:alpha/beta hydrolase-fold protein [Roseateles asaccharophilus]|uniref:Alpha/beta superfamily hydrolase n=1 Tax=Roseateles asaccharophilus TaxID=582607 RepID=A0ABU2AGM0_9BURK|nr:alpha/beta hydrolase-fold protein [Roseateles asaccharophilus]MDR7335788.1 putative alpha/beta superfamily hydrolase [Roseateles asaccharophilus]